MNSVIRFFDDIDSIIRSDYTTSEKLTLLQNLLTLVLRFIFIGPKSRRSTKTLRLLGFQLESANCASFLFMFEEIFVRLAYKFDSADVSPLIIDCGSNIGVSLAYFKSAYPCSRIIAFEPDPTVFAMLKRNVERNTMDNVVLHDEALHNLRGEIDFYRDPRDIGSGIISSTVRKRVPLVQRIRVQAALLSEYVSGTVDFLKLDVEGAEEGVLRDLHNHGKLRLIKEMAIEYHQHIDPDTDDLSSTLLLLEEDGFGYQLEAKRVPANRGFQDVLIRAYNKSMIPHTTG